MADIKSEMLAVEYALLQRKFRGIIIIAGLLLLALCAMIAYHRLRKPGELRVRSAPALEHALDSMSSHVRTIGNTRNQAVSDNVAMTSNTDAVLREMSATVFSLKSDQERLIRKVNDLTLVKQQARYDSVYAGYDTAGKVPLIARGRSDSVGVPRSFSVSDSSGSIYGRVLKSGVELDSMWVTNYMYLQHGVRKHGFLNLGREDFVEAVNNNPHMRITGLSTITYHQRPNAWNRWIKPVLAAGIGAAVTSRLVK